MTVFAKILLSFAAIQYGVIPPIVDLTSSHVFNHGWPPHARFHMVWLLTVGSGFSVYVLSLAWLPAKDPHVRLRQASIPGMIILSAFFAATLGLDLYGGGLSDLEHRIEVFGVDANIVSFSVAAIFQFTAALIVWRQKPTRL